MKPRSSMPLLTALAIAVGVTGCSFAAAEGLVVENRCSSDDDCPGARCAIETSMCVSSTATTLEIAIQITPSSDRFGSDMAQPFVIPPFDVTGPAERDLLYPTPVDVFGRAHFLMDGTPMLAQAEISFRPNDTTMTGGARQIASISYPEAA